MSQRERESQADRQTATRPTSGGGHLQEVACEGHYLASQEEELGRLEITLSDDQFSRALMFHTVEVA